MEEVPDHGEDPEIPLDVVGEWTELKLMILHKYASAYTKILEKSTLRHAYIDGFAGAGQHRSKTDPERVIPGSPSVVLDLEHRFDEYHFIDLQQTRTAELQAIADHAHPPANVTVHNGDCNAILGADLVPRFTYDRYWRALCLLDPYNLNPEWKTMLAIGKARSIEIFLNFMVMDANMNVLVHDEDKRRPGQEDRMNRFWGDGSWRDAAYREPEQGGLFGALDPIRTKNDALVNAYCERLRSVAGFKHVVEPLPMKNSIGRVVYYLVFAGPNETGARIARDVMKKHR